MKKRMTLTYIAQTVYNENTKIVFKHGQLIDFPFYKKNISPINFRKKNDLNLKLEYPKWFDIFNAVNSVLNLVF